MASKMMPRYKFICQPTCRQMWQSFNVLRQIHFDIVQTKASDQDRIMRLLKTDFFPDEPLSRSLGGGVGKVEEEVFRKAVGNGYSLMAVEKNTDNIVGVALCEVNTKLDNDDEKIAECEDKKDFGYAKILRLLKEVEKKCSFWERVGADSCLRALGTCVDRKYRNYNVAGILTEKSEYFDKGLCGLRGDGTSVNNVRILMKHGYKCIYSYRIRDFLDSDGKVVFPTEYPHTHMHVVWKEWRERDQFCQPI